MSIGLDTIDAMISETVKQAYCHLSEPVANRRATMGVGIRLAILTETRERVMKAELKVLEAAQRIPSLADEL